MESDRKSAVSILSPFSRCLRGWPGGGVSVRRRSIVRKLIVLVTLAVTSGMVVSVALAVWQEARRYADGRRHEMQATAQAFAAAAASSVAARNRQETLNAIRAIG